ncbi:flavin monoamine oxidase family protein [Streptomyces sp. 4N509B]|uniref:flavin monoamine oxidase family protein n=1 Tax=Streptomyces sp. 4N509B TaxID=3457413 RepID=UPI003FD14CD3
MEYPYSAPTSLYQAMTGMGEVHAVAFTGEVAERDDVRQDVGAGQSVLVLGAGVGGLTAAYQLLRLGYEVRVLEAQHRPGGRNFTARAGTVVTETDGTTQTCVFDEGLYLNLGPGRIPYHHRRMLHYCRELGVRLEPYVMETTANRVRTVTGFDGAPMPRRRLANDTRGHLAALLASHLWPEGMPPEGERDELLAGLLRAFGDLNEQLRYTGSTRSGYRERIDIDDEWEAPEPAPPLPFEELLRSRFWEAHFYQPEDFLWQPTLFQPVGGMDQVVRGFTRHLPADLVWYGAVVTDIELLGETGGGGEGGGEPGTTQSGPVRVRWRSDGGGRGEAVADHCLCSIPLPALADSVRLEGFTEPYLEAIRAVGFAPTCKVGWQANRRFWESNRDQMYGGISYTDDINTQVWYPSNDYFSEKGTMTGAYNYEEDALRLGEMPPRQRLETAYAAGRRLHPETWTDEAVPIDLGISIAWHRMPFERGGWADWQAGNKRHEEMYRRLLEAQGPFHMLGDQVSSLPGWQEGAMMSADWVIRQMLGIEPTSVPEVRRAPDAASLTRGRY